MSIRASIHEKANSIYDQASFALHYTANTLYDLSDDVKRLAALGSGALALTGAIVGNANAQEPTDPLPAEPTPTVTAEPTPIQTQEPTVYWTPEPQPTPAPAPTISPEQQKWLDDAEAKGRIQQNEYCKKLAFSIIPGEVLTTQPKKSRRRVKVTAYTKEFTDCDNDSESNNTQGTIDPGNISYTVGAKYRAPKSKKWKTFKSVMVPEDNVSQNLRINKSVSTKRPLKKGTKLRGFVRVAWTPEDGQKSSKTFFAKTVKIR